MYIQRTQVFKKQIFQRRIKQNSKLKKNIEAFYKSFIRFLKVINFLQNALECYYDIDDSLDNTLLELCRNECSDCSNFDDIKNEIKDVEIKDTRNFKISKFTLQIYAYVYQKIMNFPRGRFDHQTLKTKELFETIHKIVNVKVHLHHSRVTGKIIRYAHDFVI